MLCAAGNDEFVRAVIGELHGISNHIPPQSGRSGDDHCVVLVEFYFFQTADTRIFLADIFQRYEFIENTVINHHQHGRIVRVVLCAEIAFGGIICLDIVHLGTFDDLSVLFPIRSKMPLRHGRILPDWAILLPMTVSRFFPSICLTSTSIQDGTPERLVTLAWIVLLAMASILGSNSLIKAIFLAWHTDIVDQRVYILYQNGR